MRSVLIRSRLKLFKSRGLVYPGNRGGTVGPFRFISTNQAWFPAPTMARVLGVSKVGFTAWR